MSGDGRGTTSALHYLCAWQSVTARQEHLRSRTLPSAAESKKFGAPSFLLF